MTLRQLPARPSLEQLKSQAKSLLRAAQAHDADALSRFAILPAFAVHNAIDPTNLALHDAQSVIAREHGFTSWNALREEVDARMLSFDAAVDEFVRHATGGAARRAERLLILHPAIATATVHTALVRGDVAAVEERLRERPDLVSRPGGPQEWEPLLYVCHTSLHETEPSRVNGLVQIARQLCALGADPNAPYHWKWHPELPRTALWGAICVVRHLPLAEVLLDAGANPTDGVSTHIAASFGNLDALELLYRYHVNVDGIPGGVPPLVYMMQWADKPAGAFWLLDHGANPNLSWGDAGEAPLHVAARRWNVSMVEHLVSHGADIARRRGDGATPHKVAAIHGNQEIADWLLARGAQDELSLSDHFVAACARGDRASAEAMLVANPALRGQLTPQHHLMLHRPSEVGDAVVLETMLACGFDPRARDKDGVTALHRAAMGGHVDAVRVLLQHGAEVDAIDATFSAPPLVWTVQGRHRPRSGANHVGVARELIAAGSPLDWTPPPGAPSPEAILEGLIDLRRAAAQNAF
jgi:ankyrin repeat protein